MTKGGAARPDSANLAQATALLRAGDVRSASVIVQKALAATPDDPRVLQLAGGLAVQTGQKTLAVQLLTRAAALAPSNPETRCNLGLALLGIGRLDDAVRELQHALRLDGSLFAAHINLALVLSQLGQLQPAEASAVNAIALKPTLADGHQALGDILSAKGDFSAAIAAHKEAKRLAPNRAAVHAALGSTLLQNGDSAGASAAFSEAVRLEPKEGRWRQLLSRVVDREAPDARIADLRRAYADSRGQPAQHASVCFSLARALDTAGEYVEAIGLFLEAAKDRRAQFEYSSRATETVINDIKAAFTQELFAAHVATGIDDETPIFVLGMPRSGTSLVEQILASHPDVYGGGELLLLRSLIAGLVEPGMPLRYTEVVPKLTAKTLEQKGTNYVAQLRQLASGQRRITDKLPGNFLLIGFIRLMLPKAKIIYLRRDPADTCVSIFKSDFGGHHPYAYDLSELGHYYRLHRQLMEHWKRVIPDAVYELNYETLVANQESETRRLLAHCGLDWSDDCLEFFRTTRGVRTVSATQVREPIHARSIGIAERYGEGLRPLLDALAEI